MLKDKRIFNSSKDKPICITQEILDILQVGDWVQSMYVDPSLHGDYDSEGYYQFDIHRDVEETEDEIKKRELKTKKDKERLKKGRYETYLKFKKEFEDE